MLLQTNSYIVPKEKRSEHARLMRRFRQALGKLGCDMFEIYEQVGANWTGNDANGRYVQIMRFRDRKHQMSVQSAERTDPSAQALIAEFCELVNFPYQQQQGFFAVGFYNSVLAGTVGPEALDDAEVPTEEFAAGVSEVALDEPEADEAGGGFEPESAVAPETVHEMIDGEVTESLGFPIGEEEPETHPIANAPMEMVEEHLPAEIEPEEVEEAVQVSPESIDETADPEALDLSEYATEEVEESALSEEELLEEMNLEAVPPASNNGSIVVPGHADPSADTDFGAAHVEPEEELDEHGEAQAGEEDHAVEDSEEEAGPVVEPPVENAEPAARGRFSLFRRRPRND